MLIIAGEKYTCAALTNAGSTQKTLTQLVNEVFNSMWRSAKHQLMLIEENQKSHSEMEIHLLPVLKQVVDHFRQESVSYKSQLSQWLDSDSYVGEDKPIYQYKRHDQQREYLFWHEAAIALDAWVHSKPCRVFERDFAQRVYHNPYINMLINSLVNQIYEKIKQDLQDKGSVYYDVTMELLSGHTLLRMGKGGQLQLAKPFGSYRQSLHQKREVQALGMSLKMSSFINDAPMNVLMAPQDFSLGEKIALIHDLADYFGQHQIWAPETAGQGLIDTAIKGDCYISIGSTDEGVKRECLRDANSQLSRHVRGAGQNAMCRNELALSSLLGRKQQLFLWSGHSTSVVRALKLARWAGGRQAELTALSQAIIAFFRVEYHSDCPYPFHTMHEVMDMAQNFDVKYQLDPSKKGKECIQIDTVDRVYFEHFIESFTTEIESLFPPYSIKVSQHCSEEALALQGALKMKKRETEAIALNQCQGESQRMKAFELLSKLKKTMEPLTDDILKSSLHHQVKNNDTLSMNVNSRTALPLFSFQQQSTLSPKLTQLNAFYEALFSLQILLMEA
ncbi:hypothetical protein [uncultured Shewanella sp.]|uniref:hypothetical protein n=1 Tax=uncultured Shewanella sp. TaxID=173975 RepID=UPI00263223FD|nr:hypothetical protein [uncultured Shewanella sp.]